LAGRLSGWRYGFRPPCEPGTLLIFRRERSITVATATCTAVEREPDGRYVIRWDPAGLTDAGKLRQAWWDVNAQKAAKAGRSAT
jgi:hypothetical protein